MKGIRRIKADQKVGRNLTGQDFFKYSICILHYALLVSKDLQPKYWLYEMFPAELITVINESSPQDFYIVSKKLKRLISGRHEDMVYFAGEEIDISLLERQV